MSDHVTMVEVGPRDGLQNEKLKLDASIKIDLIERLANCGMPVVEAGSFVSPKWVPQMADSESVLTGIKQLPGTRYPVLVPNMAGFERAIEAGATEIAVFTAASESFSKRNTNCSIDESVARLEPVIERAKTGGLLVRGYVSCVLGCPYEGEVETRAVTDVCTALANLGVDEISLGDTIGVGTPAVANALVKAVTDVVAVEQLAVHFHDTYGQALANILACLDAGIRKSIHPLPGWAAAPTQTAPPVMSPAKTWSTCCMGWGCTPVLTWVRWHKPVTGFQNSCNARITAGRVLH